MASIRFCEDGGNGWIKEYYNTWSSLSYIITALPFLHTRVKKVAYSGVWIGIGSFFLHSTGTYWAQCIDEVAIICLIFYAIQMYAPIFPEKTLIPLTVLYFIHNKNFIYFFAMICGLGIFLTYKSMKRGDFYMRTFAYFLIAGAFSWAGDQLLCNYIGFLQLHAWWHILTSISFGFMYKGMLITKKKDK